MGVVAAITFGLCLWILLWAIGVKAVDAFILFLVIAIVAATMRMLTPYLPGKRE